MSATRPGGAPDGSRGSPTPGAGMSTSPPRRAGGISTRHLSDRPLKLLAGNPRAHRPYCQGGGQEERDTQNPEQARTSHEQVLHPQTKDDVSQQGLASAASPPRRDSKRHNKTGTGNEQAMNRSSSLNTVPIGGCGACTWPVPSPLQRGSFRVAGGFQPPASGPPIMRAVRPQCTACLRPSTFSSEPPRPAFWERGQGVRARTAPGSYSCSCSCSCSNRPLIENRPSHSRSRAPGCGKEAPATAMATTAQGRTG
jgi:hypothetical protein